MIRKLVVLFVMSFIVLYVSTSKTYAAVAPPTNLQAACPISPPSPGTYIRFRATSPAGVTNIIASFTDTTSGGTTGISWTTPSGGQGEFFTPGTLGHSYTWRAAAVSGAQTSTYVNGPSFTCTASPPPAPSGLRASCPTTRATLTWNATAGAGFYNVNVRDVTANGPWSGAGVSSPSYTLDPLNASGHTFAWTVNAVGCSGGL